MAIDSSLFVADIPAGTYAVGDIVPLKCIAGPSVVRSGRGAAILKKILTVSINNIAPNWRIHVKNSDWIDEVVNFAGQLNQATVLDDKSGCVQTGHDNNLTPNSSWEVYAECILAATSSADNTLAALIDIDYPSVSAVTDPTKLVGSPTTIDYDVPSVAAVVIGNGENATWISENVDYFKAGYQYCLNHVEATVTGGTVLGGFVAFSNAAGMGGLQRIIPVNSSINTIRYTVGYASTLQKGPMDIKMMLFAASAATVNVFMCHDFVKRRM